MVAYLITLTCHNLFERSYGWLELLDSVCSVVRTTYTAKIGKSLMNFLAFHILQLGTYFEKHVLTFVEDFGIYGAHSVSPELQVTKGCRSLSGDLIDKTGWKKTQPKQRCI